VSKSPDARERVAIDRFREQYRRRATAEIVLYVEDGYSARQVDGDPPSTLGTRRQRMQAHFLLVRPSFLACGGIRA
jgi:plasmid replication initiation protein